jgi:hypothetical protein
MTPTKRKKTMSKITSIDARRKTGGTTTKELVPDAEGLLAWVRRDPRLLEFVSSAVDRFEVAARLETFGLSARVVQTSFGFSDVFAAGKVVFDAIPYADVRPEEKPGPKMGGPLDLLRGALYAVPAIFVSVVILTFHLSVYWWLLPVGLTVAWGTTQAFTVLSWSLRDRKDHRSDAVIAASSILVTLVASLIVSLIVRAILGGTAMSVELAVSLSIYISASSVLVFHDAEKLLLLCIAPGFIGSILSLGVISDRDASWWILSSGVLVVCFALGPVLSKAWRMPTFSSSTRRQAGKFLLYGIGCGLMTSAVIGFATNSTRSSGSVAIAAGPLLVTLGLMEWQLRSFRSRTSLALRETSDLAQFGQKARSAMARSMLTYIAFLLVTSVAATIIALARHETMAPLLILTVDTIGTSFFLALIFVSAGLINRVLLAWVVTFFVMGAIMIVSWVASGHVSADLGIVSVLASSCCAIGTLTLLSRRVLLSPLNYEIQS